MEFDGNERKQGTPNLVRYLESQRNIFLQFFNLAYGNLMDKISMHNIQALWHKTNKKGNKTLKKKIENLQDVSSTTFHLLRRTAI